MISFNELITIKPLIKKDISILQINVGNYCNQQCSHCHIEAGPTGSNMITKDVLENILHVLAKNSNIKTIDITGGSPESSNEILWFLNELKKYDKEVIFRSNLTALLNNKGNNIINLLKERKAQIIASMPCYTKDNVDSQRGNNVFENSLKSLKKLNECGYGTDDLKLNLMYNPGGAFLPGNQYDLEKDYKKELLKYEIKFNNLYTLANAPIGRFKEWLKKEGQFENYENLLYSNFNKENLAKVMCLNTLSVDYKGKLYDCDFNLALKKNIKSSKFKTICDLLENSWDKTTVVTGNHCLTCTAGMGASCQGSL